MLHMIFYKLYFRENNRESYILGIFWKNNSRVSELTYRKPFTLWVGLSLVGPWTPATYSHKTHFLLTILSHTNSPRSSGDLGQGFLLQGLLPGQSVAGSYDNEGIAILCILLTYYMWIKAVKTGSIFWATLCALAYFCMVRFALHSGLRCFMWL